MTKNLISNRNYLSLLLTVGVITGLLFSRAVLSICIASGFLLMLYYAATGGIIKKHLRIVLIFVVALVVFYSYIFFIEAKPAVAKRLLFYLCTISIVYLAFFIADLSRLTVPLIILSGLVSCVPTVINMLLQEGLAAAYEKGQVAKTLMGGDHQRFSIWISGCLALAWLSFLKKGKTWMAVCITLLSLFLAVLAVRTGWLFLIIINVAAGLSVIVNKISFRKSIWILITGVILLTGAFTVPFVTKKINYVMWEWFQQNEADKLAGSDATRRMVNSEALALVKQHPFGMGISNGPENVKRMVKNKYPQTVNAYGWPFNQYLYWWLVAGWIMGSLPLLVILFLLARFITAKTIFTAAWVFFIMITCLYESTLEMQYGLLLAVFFTGIFYKEEISEHKNSPV